MLINLINFDYKLFVTNHLVISNVAGFGTIAHACLCEQ